jgi:hypothetical protein
MVNTAWIWPEKGRCSSLAVGGFLNDPVVDESGSHNKHRGGG